LSETPASPAIDVTYFDALFDAGDDPWRFRTRWYEARKRALTLACLPAPRYASAYEPACANGELSAALASRCDQLLVSDVADRAVALARARLRVFEHVTVSKACLPRDWPETTFELIVLSEFCYYLDTTDLRTLAQQVLASLRPGGTVLACHWRRQIAGGLLNGDQVHEILGEQLSLPHLCGVVEPDLRIDVWSLDPRSVAEREGLP